MNRVILGQEMASSVREIVDTIYPDEEGRDVVLNFVLRTMTDYFLIQLCLEGRIHLSVEGGEIVFSLRETEH